MCRHECLVDYEFLCMLICTCGKVYSDVVVVVMHVVMVCVIDMVMH